MHDLLTGLVKLGRLGLGPVQHAKGVKIGCYSGLTCEPLQGCYAIHELTWLGFVKKTQVHTGFDALKYRNEMRNI
jgi:hypothetical protein